MWVSSAVWWSIRNVGDRQNWRREIASRRGYPSAGDRSVSSRVLKYLIACEASGRGGEISTAAVELIVEGRDHRLSLTDVVLRSIRSDDSRWSQRGANEGQTWSPSTDRTTRSRPPSLSPVFFDRPRSLSIHFPQRRSNNFNSRPFLEKTSLVAVVANSNKWTHEWKWKVKLSSCVHLL